LQGATDNYTALLQKLPHTYKGEPITVNFLLNPSHLSGLQDLTDSLIQKYFNDATVDDYDFNNMWTDASSKVATQKLLLVGHSQGNFYANRFYDTWVNTVGGVPRQSLAVYGVANPDGRVAGGGAWLTSDTDLAIAKLVSLAPGRNIVKPNVHIALASGDDFWGHNFDSIYMKYQGTRIVSDVEKALDGLANNDMQSVSGLCIAPPKTGVAHAIEAGVYALADPLAKGIGGTVATAAQQTALAYRGIQTATNYASRTIAGSMQNVDKTVAKNPMSVYAGLAGLEAMAKTPKKLATSDVAKPRPPTPAELATLLRQAQSLQDQMIGLRVRQKEMRTTPNFGKDSPSPKGETLPTKTEVAPPKPTASIVDAFKIIQTANAYQPGFGGGGSGTSIPEVRPQTPPEVSPQIQDATSTPPTDLLAVRGNKAVLLSWLAPSNSGGAEISDYEIHESSDNFSANDTKLTDGVSTATSTLVAGLTNGTLYYFRIVAVNRAGTSTTSNVTTVLPGIPPPPPAFY